MRHTAFVVCVGLILLATMCMLACDQEQRSEIMTEQAVVSEVIYTPPTHGSGLGYDITGKGGLSVTSVDIDPQYAVVFQCQHGKFVIQGKDERHKELWARFKSGDPVEVRYQAVYLVDEEKKTKRLTKYDFLDAWKVG